jgi:organic radical activating enzyme
MSQALSVSYPIMEHFYSLQGEGFFAGTPAYFIRLAGCDVGCVWCDVKESWEADIHPVLTVETLVNAVLDAKCELVVITGGEPTLYDLTALVNELHKHNKKISIETSGTNALIGNVDWYTFSPKKFKAPVEEAFQKASEFKVIIYHQSDFEWAEKLAQQLNPNCLLYLQPEWSKKEQFLPSLIEFVKKHPKWRVSLQTHKYLEIP